MSDFWWIKQTAPVLHFYRVLQWPSSWYLMFSWYPKSSCIILYLQLTDLRGDVPHQVLVQEIQAIWTEQVRQGPQLCSEGCMNYWDHGGEEQRRTDVDNGLNVHYKLHKRAHAKVKAPAVTGATDPLLLAETEREKQLKRWEPSCSWITGPEHGWMRTCVVKTGAG